MIEISKDIYKEWYDACTCSQFGSYQSLYIFKNKYPKIFKFISCMIRKRTKINSIVKAYFTLGTDVYWGDLTFDDLHNDGSNETKRKQVIRFFNKFFKLFTFVEELGSENGRYHVHFFGVMMEYSNFDEMRSQWHSFLHCERLLPLDSNKKVKYLTKYAVKDVPRVRMDRRSCKLLIDYKRFYRLKVLGFDDLSAKYIDSISDILDLPF